MKKLFITAVICLLSVGAFNQNSEREDYHDWWNEGYWEQEELPEAQKLPKIQVEGNRFVNEKGEAILFRGLSIPDPDKLVKQGQWKKEYFESIKDFGAMMIRIPIHPIAWQERTPFEYMKLIDQAVKWCTELDIYIIIDWHSIGNLVLELYQAPMYNTTQKETFEFWQMISKQYAGNNTVAFYEVFNEPTMYRGQLGKMTWTEWKALVEKIIGVIRYHDKETVCLVAGFDWAYDLTFVKYDPINAQNIGYVTHPYAFKRSQPWELKWEENFGFAADDYPIIATEIGFGFHSDRGEGDNPEYGNAILNYLESKNISWMAWIYDPEWEPAMIKDWNYKLTEGGAFFKKAMKKK